MLVDGFLRAALPSCVIGAAIIAASTGPVTAATIEVTVSGVIPHGGSVLTTLCDGGLDGATCAQGQSQPASATVVTFAFQGIEPGRYAILAFQDTDGHGVLRRSRMGRPLDPYGLSNGAGRSHRPTFEQAAVRVGVTGARIAIRLEQPGSL